MTPDRRPIRQRLAAWYSPEEIRVWMSTGHPQLDGRIPEDVIRAGGAEEVHRLIDRLDEGVYL